MQFVVIVSFFVTFIQSLYLICAKKIMSVHILLPRRKDMSDFETFAYDQIIEKARRDYKDNDNFIANIAVNETSCDDIDVSQKISELTYKTEVGILIAPPCNKHKSCKAAVRSAKYNKKIMFLYQCNELNYQLDGKMIRVRPIARDDIQTIVNTFEKIAREFQWNRLGVIHTRQHNWNEVSDVLIEALVGKNFNVYNYTVDKFCGTDSMAKMVKDQVRIILILCPMEKTVEIIEYFYKQVQQETEHKINYAIFTIDLHLEYLQEILQVIPEEALNGIINIRASFSRDVENPIYNNFIEETQILFNKTKAHKLPMNTTKPTQSTTNGPETSINTSTSEQLKTESNNEETKTSLSYDNNAINLKTSTADTLERTSYLYDSIATYFESVRKVVKQHYSEKLEEHKREMRLHEFFDANNITSYKNYMKIIQNRTYGINTKWKYPEHWNEKPSWYKGNTSFPVINLTTVEENLDYVSVLSNWSLIKQQLLAGEVQGLSNNITFKNFKRQPKILIENIVGLASHKITQNKHWSKAFQSVIWFNGAEERPLDVPKCGFQYDQCEPKIWNLTITMSIIAAVFFFLSIMYASFRLQKFENDLNSQVSVINFNKLRTTYLTVENSHVKRRTVCEELDRRGKLNTLNGVRRLTVYYGEDQVLMMKKFPKVSVNVDRNMMIEIKTLRDLNSQTHINNFIGVTLQEPNICVLYTYCSKGSLFDIFQETEMKFDWDFKYTFISDIIMGLLAIHESSIKYHGRLTSKNCLVNHRWVLQISDFGLCQFRKATSSFPLTLNKEDNKELLWSAPEHLSIPLTGSKAGDMYSFGIILSEIITQKVPYYERNVMDASEIVWYVRRRCIPPFRPHVVARIGCDGRLMDLMRHCWEEIPEDRPTIKQIRPMFRKIRGRKIEILDNMMNMMEKYTKELEKTIVNSNNLLLSERDLKNQIILRSLPKCMATTLLENEGRKCIEPIELCSVSFLYVAIANFIEMDNTPDELVDIVNSFQIMVEKLLMAYKNVHCLHTIREEIILCSNVPGHTQESNALTLMQVAIRIYHVRNIITWPHVDKVKFKVLLHTGEGYGIVVGTRIPTYCILSKALEDLKRLAQTTQKEKIVMTDDFKALLQHINGEIPKCPQEIMCIPVKIALGVKKRRKTEEEKHKKNSRKNRWSSINTFDFK